MSRAHLHHVNVNQVISAMTWLKKGHCNYATPHVTTEWDAQIVGITISILVKHGFGCGTLML